MQGLWEAFRLIAVNYLRGKTPPKGMTEEDVVSACTHKCILKQSNYKSRKGANPFAYFTSVIRWEWLYMMNRANKKDELQHKYNQSQAKRIEDG